jgi:hypothetical protein
MVKAGKPARVAIVAIFRKLLILATPLSAIGENGPLLTLDQHGHCRGRLGKDRSLGENRHSIAIPK